MNKIWKYFLFIASILIIVEIAVVAILWIENELVVWWTSLVIFVANILLFFVLFFTFVFFLRQKVLISRQVVSYVDRTAENFVGLGVCIYDKNQEIIWVNYLIEKRNKRNLIGILITDWLPEISLLINNNNQKLKITKNNRKYEIRLLKESSTILLHDVTNYEGLLEYQKDESLVMGSIYIDNLKNLISAKSERFQIRLISIINEEISAWSEKYNIFIKSFDRDNYMFMLKHSDYQKLIKEEKFQFIKTIKTRTDKMGAPISLSIGVGYGVSDPNLLYSVASNNLTRSIQKGGNQVISQNYFETSKQVFGMDIKLIEKSTSIETKLFGRTLKERIMNAQNILISGHKWGDFDSIASSISLYYLAKFFKKEVKIMINFDLIDNNAKENLFKIIPKSELANLYIKPKNAYKMIKNDSLLIVADTHIKHRIEEPSIVDLVQNIVVIDHHLLADTDVIITPDSYIQAKASSTCEIMVLILSQYIKQNDLPDWAINLLFTGILLDTNNFKVRTTQGTFETAALLKSWGADPDIAQNLLKEDLEHILLKQSITSKAFELLPGYICACAPNKTKIPRSLIAQVAQDLSQIKGIKAAFAFSYDDSGIASMSARSNGIVNVEIIAEAMGGGGHYNASASQNENKTLEEFFLEFKDVFHKKFTEKNNNK